MHNPTSLLSDRRFRSVALSTALAAVLAACGGKVSVDGSGTGGAGGGAGGAGGTTSSDVSTTVTTNASTSVVTVGVTSTGSDVTTSVGVGPDTTATSGVSGVTTSITTGTGGSDATVFCDGESCNSGEICCFNLFMPSDHCGQAGTCGDGYIELACNGPEDCPGQVCCGHLDQMFGQVPYSAMLCEASCTGDTRIIVCGDAGDAACNPGTECKKSQVLGDGYRVCKPN